MLDFTFHPARHDILIQRSLAGRASYIFTVMAPASSDDMSATLLAEDDLSDEQIQQLLARASARLEGKTGETALQLADEGRTKFSFPKLDTGALVKPYVTTNGDVASVNPARLLEEKHRKGADGPRTVEDPVAAKKLAIEVCIRVPLSILLHLHEENNPKFLSRADSGHRFGLPSRTT